MGFVRLGLAVLLLSGCFFSGARAQFAAVSDLGMPPQSYGAGFQIARISQHREHALGTGDDQPITESVQDASDETIARYTEVLVWFTAIMGIATVGLGIVGIYQIRLSLDEFNATHRPKVATRFFRPNTTERGANFGDNMSIFFHIVNEGDADARVIEVGTRVFEWSGP